MQSTAKAISPDSGTHWSEPGAWPVAPGVHRIPLPLPMDGLRAVNVYAIETPEGLTLIDGGWAIEESRKVLDWSLAQIDRSVADIRSFLVTHAHRDHYTQAVALRREVGSQISLGLGDKPSLDFLLEGFENGDPHVAMLQRAGAHDVARTWAEFTASSSYDRSLWAHPDIWLDGDHSIAVGDRTLDAVHTPGHTQGHFVFAEQQAGLLFAGDHVLPTITPSIGFEVVSSELPLGEFMTSLARVRQLPDLQLLPAHGPVAASSHTRVDELLAHHEHRLALCLDALRGGPAEQRRELTAHDVADQLPWTRHEHAFSTLDVFNAALATMETQAHLRLLVARGAVRVTLVGSEGDSDVYRMA